MRFALSCPCLAVLLLSVGAADASIAAHEPEAVSVCGVSLIAYTPYDDRTVPYFAAHPPVYFSYPVAFPYGYPHGWRGCDTSHSQHQRRDTRQHCNPKMDGEIIPKVINNPFYSVSTERFLRTTTADVEPVRIQNPYCGGTPPTDGMIHPTEAF
ncbi:hypothetical protein JCM19992_27390 [Thermostilla marina]